MMWNDKKWRKKWHEMIQKMTWNDKKWHELKTCWNMQKKSEVFPEKKEKNRL